MDQKKVVTRMAPSPTGDYHIGHLRTVLYNWAWARKNGGEFFIRIEDTDRTRFVEGATERILKDIKDYGFDWDREPVYQSERLPIYKEHAERLVADGHAYYCFCTAERLDEMRQKQQEEKRPTTKYDRLCLNLPKEEVNQKLSNNVPHVIRLKVPDNRKISFDDIVFGHVEIDSNDIDDQVLLKSDGFPTYQLAVVIDDHLMGVTHIMRGNDWLPSTPKHVLLYEAFGWEMPIHAHLPNLKEIGGSKKLSKRFGSVFAREFLNEGYIPEALDNFLMFLGWNPGTDREIYSLAEFIETFSLEKIHKTDLVAFDRKKLDWFNSQYLSQKTDTEIADLLAKYLPSGADTETLPKICGLLKSRIKKLSEFQSIANFFYENPAVDKSLFSESYIKHLESALSSLINLNEFTALSIGEALLKSTVQHVFDRSNFFMDLRIAITGKKVSPPLNESMEILGKESVIARLKNAIQ